MTTRVQVLGPAGIRLAQAAAERSPNAAWEPASAVLIVTGMSRDHAIQHAALLVRGAKRRLLGLRWDGVQAL